MKEGREEHVASSGFSRKTVILLIVAIVGVTALIGSINWSCGDSGSAHEEKTQSQQPAGVERVIPIEPDYHFRLYPDERQRLLGQREFSLGAGEKKLMSNTGPGTYFKMRFNKPFQAASLQPDGSINVYEYQGSGWHAWKGGFPGHFELRGLHPGTVVKIYKIK